MWGAERDRRLNSALATREEVQVEDALSLPANASPGWEGRWVLQKGPDFHLFYVLLVRKRASGISLLRLIPDLRNSLASFSLYL